MPAVELSIHKENASYHPESLQPVLTGSREFEIAYGSMVEGLGFTRSVVWRGFMPGKARFRYLDTFSAPDNNDGILKADFYQSTETPDIYFYYVYQKPASIPDTVMTYIISTSRGPILQKSDQIARYGTYRPKTYQVNASDVLPVIEGYRGGCRPVSINRIKEHIPQISRTLTSRDNVFFSTNRLATYLYDRTVSLGMIDKQQIKAKVFLHVAEPSKYIAEVMPMDEEGGIVSFDKQRFEETNDNWYALSHQLYGPIVPPSLQVLRRDSSATIDLGEYSGLSVLSGNDRMWIVGIPNGMPWGTLHYFDASTRSQGEAVDFLFHMAKNSTPDEVLNAIKAYGLSDFLPEEYR